MYYALSPKGEFSHHCGSPWYEWLSFPPVYFLNFHPSTKDWLYFVVGWCVWRQMGHIFSRIFDFSKFILELFITYLSQCFRHLKAPRLGKISSLRVSYRPRKSSVSVKIWSLCGILDSHFLPSCLGGRIRRFLHFSIFFWGLRHNFRS